jgi:hypothetical protein
MATEHEDLEHNPGQQPTDAEVKLLEGEPAAGEDTLTGGEHEADDGEDEEEVSARRDSELEQARTDQEREAIRERRRNERKNKQQRQREKIDTLSREVEMLRQQNAGLAQKVGGIESATLSQSMAALEQEIQQAQQAATHFSRLAADAVKKADGDTWMQAAEKADTAKRRLAELNALKTNVTQAQTRQQTQAQPLNPEMVRRATSFKDKNSWYGGPQSTDMDSQILTQLDAALIREGWDPTSDAYWQELEARKNKYLPHRAAAGGTTTNAGGERKPPRSPVAGASNGSAQPGKGTYQLSAERVRAMKEAGLWNDEKKRAAAIDRYRKYDQEHGIKG